MSNLSFIRIKSLFNAILSSLSPESKSKILGEHLNYHAKVLRIKTLTKCPKTLNLCNDLQDELYRSKLTSGVEF